MTPFALKGLVGLPRMVCSPNILENVITHCQYFALFNDLKEILFSNLKFMLALLLGLIIFLNYIKKLFFLKF